MPRNPTDLRRAILDRARALLLEEGPGALTMRRIARAVGCTPTSIYLYFRGKDALLHALIEEGMERLWSELEDAAELADPRERLAELCRRYLRFGLSNPEYYEVMFCLRPDRMERFPPEKYRLARRNLELFAAPLAELAAARGRAVEPLLAASVTWAALHGAVALLIAERVDRSLDREAFVEAAARQACAAAESAGAQAGPSPVHDGAGPRPDAPSRSPSPSTTPVHRRLAGNE